MSTENNVSECTPITQNNLNEQQNPSITIRDFDGKLHRIFLELNSLTIQLLKFVFLIFGNWEFLLLVVLRL